MNNERRKFIRSATVQLEEVRIAYQALDEEQSSYDNMPESLQNGEKGEKMQEAISFARRGA